MSTKLGKEERAAALQRMTTEHIDVLVIGGGITGAGVALEAAARGYSVGLIDKGDFAGGTSSKSTKLVHGGIRYLPQFDFALVREALIERGLMARNAPHLVKPLGFVLPYYKENKRPLGTPIVPPGGVGMSQLLNAGLLMYDTFAGKLGIGHHEHIGIEKTLKLAPSLKSDGLKDGFVYYDGQTDDTRLTMTVLRTAAKKGALLANYVELMGFDVEKESDSLKESDSSIKAARVRDVLSGEEFAIHAKTIINAAGVWADKIESLAGVSKIVIKPAKGVHLTLPREALPTTEYAVVLPETPDGRLLFIVPWNTRVTLGTTDTKGGDIDAPVSTSDDIEYLLNTANAYLKTKLTRKDVISAWAGYRPLISPAGNDGATSKLSRTHIVNDGPAGMITITGGKLTSYRRMAQDTIDHLDKRLSKSIQHVTENLSLDGAEGHDAGAMAIKQAAAKFDWSDDVIARLSEYGSEAESLLQMIAQDESLARVIAPALPYVMAEVAYACRSEMAMTLDDVLARRLHLSIEDETRGVQPAPAVAQVMARELGWSDVECAAQIAQYTAAVEQEMAAEKS